MSFVSLSDTLRPFVNIPYYFDSDSSSGYGSSVTLDTGSIAYYYLSNGSSSSNYNDFGRLAFYRNGTGDLSRNLAIVCYVPDNNLSANPPNSRYKLVCTRVASSGQISSSSDNFSSSSPQLLNSTHMYGDLSVPTNMIIYDNRDDAIQAVMTGDDGSGSIVYDSTIDSPVGFKFSHSGLRSILSNLLGLGASGTVVWSNIPDNSVYVRLLVTVPGSNGDFYIPLVDFDDRMIASSGSYSIYRSDISSKFDLLYPDNNNPIIDQLSLRDLRLQFYKYDAESDMYSVSPMSVININNGGILGMYSSYINSVYYPISESDLGVRGGFGDDFYAKWSNVGGSYVGYNDNDNIVSDGSITSDINTAITTNIANSDASTTFNNDYNIYQYNISIGGGSVGDGSSGVGLPNLYDLLVSWMRDFGTQLANLETIVSSVFVSVSDLVGSVPVFFSDAFSFLPAEFTSLLMISISICVILRFLGR